MKAILSSLLRRFAQCATFVSLLGLSSHLHADSTNPRPHGTGTWNQYARVQSTGGGSGIRYSVALHINCAIKNTDLARYQGYVAHDTAEGRRELGKIMRSMNTQDNADLALATLATLIESGGSIAPWKVNAFHDYNAFALVNDGVELFVEEEIAAGDFSDVCKFFEGKDTTGVGRAALKRVFQNNPAAQIRLRLN